MIEKNKIKNKNYKIKNRNIAGLTHKESMSQYYQKNKIEFLNKAKLKHNCSCGGKFTYNGKSQHGKTKKHQDYINNSKTIINNGTLNINITLNNPEDLDKILKTINK